MKTNQIKSLTLVLGTTAILSMLSISPSIATIIKTPHLNADLISIQTQTQAYNKNTSMTPFAITAKDYQKIVNNGNVILKNMLTAVNNYQDDVTTLWSKLPVQENPSYPARGTLKAYGVAMTGYIESQIADLAMVQSCIPVKTKISTCIQQHYPSIIVKEKAAIASLKIPYQDMSVWATKYHKSKVG